MAMQSNPLLDAALSQLVPCIMGAIVYEELPFIPRDDKSYHCFIPVTECAFEDLEVEMYYCNGNLCVMWGDKRININPDAGHGFVAFFYPTLREDVIAQQFATLESVIDRAIQFVLSSN